LAVLRHGWVVATWKVARLAKDKLAISLAAARRAAAAAKKKKEEEDRKKAAAALEAQLKKEAEVSCA
jgi:hypothetical protein